MALSRRPFLAAIIPLLSAIPSALARCVFDSDGNEFCDGLSNGARIGIAIGIFLLVTLILVALGAMRRRRLHRINQAYITNPSQFQPGTYPQGISAQQTYPQQQGYDQSFNNAAPQYPPPTHGDQYNQYNAGYTPPAGYNAEQYHPPSGTPPQYQTYAAPTGPPPTKQ